MSNEPHPAEPNLNYSRLAYAVRLAMLEIGFEWRRSQNENDRSRNSNGVEYKVPQSTQRSLT